MVVFFGSFESRVLDTIREREGSAMGCDKGWRIRGHQSRDVQQPAVLHKHRQCMYVDRSSAYSVDFKFIDYHDAAGSTRQSKIAVEAKWPAVEGF